MDALTQRVRLTMAARRGLWRKIIGGGFGCAEWRALQQ